MELLLEGKEPGKDEASSSADAPEEADAEAKLTHLNELEHGVSVLDAEIAALQAKRDAELEKVADAREAHVEATVAVGVTLTSFGLMRNASA